MPGGLGRAHASLPCGSEVQARDRPLGQARLLWEIGPDGSDVRRLRARLDLDSGYLSRLLRSLESDELVRVEPNEADGRVRTARLTPAGRAEQAELDRLSNDAAAALLEPLSPRQRDRLTTAMAEVERLLLASAIQIGVCDPAGSVKYLLTDRQLLEHVRRP